MSVVFGDDKVVNIMRRTKSSNCSGSLVIAGVFDDNDVIDDK